MAPWLKWTLKSHVGMIKESKLQITLSSTSCKNEVKERL